MSCQKITTYDLCKKMRDEVSYVANRMYFLVDRIDSDSLRSDFKDYIRRLNDLVYNISLVPRNCDVGTAEEQEERYIKLKREHIDKLAKCPAEGHSFFFPDSLYWAQMPYEEVK